MKDNKGKNQNNNIVCLFKSTLNMHLTLKIETLKSKSILPREWIHIAFTKQNK